MIKPTEDGGINKQA